MGKKTRGRQKIEMKKIENEGHLQVTFSKRRNGLIKMANEMGVLTGSEVALIVFSPGNRVYPFGTPDVNQIIDRYENETRQPPPPTNNPDMLVQANPTPDQLRLNSEVWQLENEVLALTKQGKMLDQMIEERKNKNCNLETLIKDLEEEKLEELLEFAKDLHKDVTQEISKMAVDFFPQGNNTNDGANNPLDVSSPIYNLFSSLDIGEIGSSSNELAPSYISGEIGTAGVVQFAGPSRIIDGGAVDMTPGASSSNPMTPGFHGLDTLHREFNLGDVN